MTLLTASPPGDDGVGQVYNRDVLCQAPFDWLDCCAVLPSLDVRATQPAIVRNSLLVTRKSEFAFYPHRGCGLPSLGVYLIRLYPWAVQQARSVLKFCHDHHSTELLAVLESPQTILMADWIGRNSNLNIHSLVWDHPEHIVASFGHSGWTRRRLLAAFQRCLKRSASIITVADSLRTCLQRENPDVNCTSIRSPVSTCLPVVQTQQCNGGIFVIGMAGSITAPEEFERLQSTLDACNWRVGGREIVLRLFGLRFVLSAKAKRNVQYCGFLPTTSDVIEALSKCDACFLPQPFDHSRRLVAEYSFPTKLSTYFAAGRPVIVHAPATASVPVFLRSKSHSPINDLLVTETEPQSLLSVLDPLVTDRKFYQSQLDAVLEFCNNEFSESNCRERLLAHFQTTRLAG